MQLDAPPPFLDGFGDDRISEAKVIGGAIAELETCAHSLAVEAVYNHSNEG